MTDASAALAPLPAPALGGGGGGDDADRKGRWHGLVYVEVPRTRRFLAVAARALGARGDEDDRSLCRDAHVSVSRPFALWHHEADPFVARVRQKLRNRGARPFTAVVDGEETREMPSEDGTRSFAALAASDDENGGGFARVVDAVDDALAAFGRPAYHAERAYHVSVAETTARSRSRSRSRSRDSLDSDGPSDDSDGDDRVYVPVDAVVVKYGHHRVVIPLAAAP